MCISLCWPPQFNDWLPHKSGPIEITRPASDRTFFWRVQRGWGCVPEKHAHGHILTLFEGTGLIHIDGQVIRYGPDDEFVMEGWIPHSILRADTSTTILQKPYARTYLPER